MPAVRLVTGCPSCDSSCPRVLLAEVKARPRVQVIAVLWDGGNGLSTSTCLECFHNSHNHAHLFLYGGIHSHHRPLPSSQPSNRLVTPHDTAAPRGLHVFQSEPTAVRPYRAELDRHDTR